MGLRAINAIIAEHEQKGPEAGLMIGLPVAFAVLFSFIALYALKRKYPEKMPMLMSRRGKDEQSVEVEAAAPGFEDLGKDEKSVDGEDAASGLKLENDNDAVPKVKKPFFNGLKFKKPMFMSRRDKDEKSVEVEAEAAAPDLEHLCKDEKSVEGEDDNVEEVHLEETPRKVEIVA